MFLAGEMGVIHVLVAEFFFTGCTPDAFSVALCLWFGADLGGPAWDFTFGPVDFKFSFDFLEGL